MIGLGILVFGLAAWLSGCSYGIAERAEFLPVRLAVFQAACLIGMAVGGLLLIAA